MHKVKVNACVTSAYYTFNLCKVTVLRKLRMLGWTTRKLLSINSVGEYMKPTATGVLNALRNAVEALVFWNRGSRWDFFAMIAVVQWYSVALAIPALIAYSAGSTWGLMFLYLFAGVALVCNAFAWLVPLATVFGSKHHPQMKPGFFYHLAGLFFGPIVGVHYLLRTRDEPEAAQESVKMGPESELSTTR